MTMFGDASDLEYQALVAENQFINKLQVSIERAMDERNLKQADIARLLKVSEARISQILSGNGKNLQARTIARMAFALGYVADVEFRDLATVREPEQRVRLGDGGGTGEPKLLNDAGWCAHFAGYNDNFWTQESDEPREVLVAA